jgi:flagellar biosynthesis chaperone FliJ
MSDTTLDETVQTLRQKADHYQEATNFEAKLGEYTNDASAAQTSVYGLQSRIEEMERFYAIYTEVFDPEAAPEDPEDIDGAVQEARTRARQVLDYTPDDYWRLLDSGEIEDYKTKVQTARSEVDDARQQLRDALNRRQSYWEDRIDTSRTVLTLMSDTREAEQLLSDIESFVQTKMWNDSNSVSALQADWQGIQRKLERDAVADWGEFRERHGLSRDTIDLLKRLAEGEAVSFDALDREIVDEMLGVDDLRDALEVTL